MSGISDNYSRAQMVGLGISFIILPTIGVGLRIWAKLLGHRGIAWDDYLILAALAVAIACCAIQLVAAIDGQLGQHQTVGADGQPLLDDPRFVLYEKCKFAAQMLAIIGLGFTKSSILVFYMKIFFGRTFRLCSQAMLGIVMAWTISFFFSNLFTCYPITPFVEAFYNNCYNGVPMWYASCITDIIVDVMILVMPIPVVLKLRLPTKQKIGVLGMFLLGAMVCAFSMTRFAMYLHVGGGFLAHYNDETYYTSPVFFWSNIELSTAVISACLPTYRSIWMYLRGTPVSSKASVPLGPYPRSGKSQSSIPGYRYAENQRLGSETDYQDDVALTREPSVSTQISAETVDHVAVEHGISVQQSFYQDGRPIEEYTRMMVEP